MYRIFFIYLIMLVSVKSFTQTYSFKLAKNLFDEKKYSAAQSILDEFVSSNNYSAEILYLNARCSKELFLSDAVFKYNQLNNLFPFNDFRNLTNRDLGLIYYRQGNFTEASNYLLRLKDLSYELQFKLAYSLFSIDSIQNAKLYFSKIMNSDSKFASTSRYYYAYINYSGGFYQSALASFKKLLNDDKFKNIVPYYISQIYFSQKNYNQLIFFAKPILENVIASRKSEINRLLAEAYFQLDDFSSSIVHFESFLQESLENNLNEHLLLGYAYYKTLNYDKAIAELQNISSASDSILQYSSYYLGESYLMKSNFNYALQAFKKSSSLNFDKKIKEAAYYNYAKLSYQLELPFDNTFDVLSKYVKEFDNEVHKKEIEGLIVKMLQSSSKYYEAFSALNAIKSPSLTQKKAIQETSFFLGVQEFNQKNFNKSIFYFTNSEKFPINETYSYLSNFWLSDCYYHLNRFGSSIDGFLSLPYKESLKEYDFLKKYKLGYSYFKNSDFKNAIKWFRAFEIEITDSIKLNDTYLRLADSYFMTKDFILSSKYYKQAVQLGIFDSDYASYQYAISLGLVGENNKKYQVLTNFISKYRESAYYDNSLLILAEQCKNNSQYDLANDYYNNLIDNCGDDDLVANAYLSKGMIFLNTGDSQKAIDMFLYVINNFQKTIFFKQALSGLQVAYSSLGNIDKYLSIVEQLPGFSISKSEQDSLTYNSAFYKFSELDYVVANKSFENYISKFSDGLFINDAQYFNAISLLYLKDTVNAVLNYEKLIDCSSRFYKENALMFLSRFSYREKNFEKSDKYYSMLEDIVSSNSVKREVVIRLMSINEFSNIQKALLYANKVVEFNKTDNWLLSKAKIIVARDEFESGNYAKAKLTYKKIASLSDYDEGAEANYYLAYLAFLDDNLDVSENLIFELAENFSNDFYIAKAFILLSDIYILKKNLFQAKATLESIIENHDNELIINIARKKWESIVESEQEKTVKPEVIQSFIEISEEVFDYDVEEIDDNYAVPDPDIAELKIDTAKQIKTNFLENEFE